MGAEESVRDYLHLIMHCIFRHPFDKHRDCREAWELTCDIVVENAVIELCGGRFASELDDARREAVSEIRMLAGKIVPGAVYALLRNVVKTPDGQSYRGLGKSVLADWRAEAVSEIRMLAGKIVPGAVYALLRNVVKTPDGQSYRGLGKSVLADWRALFERDDHGAWPAFAKGGDAGEQSDPAKDDDADEAAAEDAIRTDSPDDEAAAEDAIRTDSPDDQTQEQPAGGEDVEAAEDEQPADEGARESAEDADDADAESRPDERPQDAEDQKRREREWEDVSKQIEMNLETFSREWGDEAGSLVANLAFANRKIHGYTDFLKRFMTASEEMRLNMDEFDCIYYTYGMDLYGNMPLIEPLEYKETERVREFAVVIDTSESVSGDLVRRFLRHTFMDLYGNMPLIEPLEYKETERVREFAVVIDTSESVSGDLVRRFLRHTFSILKSSEAFARDVNIHLIQCDAKVQADTKIRNLRDVDKMMEGFVVRGFGGTDFRPAFDYVEQLRRRGEFKNLKGLIYFTDGFGRFPEKTPDFDARHTFSILKSSEAFTRDVNIHLIQCDAKVQADTKIRNLRDVDKMMEGFVVRGFGGTDFRPAFDYVEQLRRRGEFKNLKGLIYFTDGFGRFPEITPDFDAAFVFMDDGDQIPAVPPWAMKAVIDEEQLDSFG